MDRLHIPLHKLVLMLAHSVDLVGQDDYFHATSRGLDRGAVTGAIGRR